MSCVFTFVVRLNARIEKCRCVCVMLNSVLVFGEINLDDRLRRGIEPKLLGGR